MPSGVFSALSKPILLVFSTINFGRRSQDPKAVDGNENLGWYRRDNVAGTINVKNQMPNIKISQITMAGIKEIKAIFPSHPPEFLNYYFRIYWWCLTLIF